jgi:glycopeptide antibiotics resistance protein
VGKRELPMISNYESQDLLRKMYFGAVLLTILLGLASRKYSHLLFPFIAENAGDVLWAMMVYFGFRFLLVNKSMITAFLLSFLFSFGIEFSQLYQEDWMNQIRGTLLGALILGKGFLLVDLIRYSTGIVIAYSLDRLVSIKKQKNI